MKLLTILTALLALFALTAYPQESVSTGDSAAQIASIMAVQAVQGDTTRPPADFVDVDKEPVLVVKKEPAYPELAKRAGIEGKVWVKIWVDKTGMPRDVVVLKSDAEILNAAALAAARQFRFTPAYIKDRPVDVWVSVPFRFTTTGMSAPKRAGSDTVGGRFPKEIVDFARYVLEGGSPDSGMVNAIVGEHEQSIVKGYLKPLVLALREQHDGKQSIEEPGRKVGFFTGGMSDNGRSGYIVARTEKKGKLPHYHTIVIQQDAQGAWKIVHWHTWHSSR